MEKVTLNYNGDAIEMYVFSIESDYVSATIKYHRNFYEGELLTFIKNNFAQQKNIVDIGANIGNHTLFFAKNMECNKIFSFEPIAENVQLFRKNLENYGDKVTLFENALSNHRGKMVLYNSEINNYGGFSLYKQEKSYEVGKTIEVTMLDDFQLTDVTLIKIDVENHENEVLMGAIETINKYKPIIVLENSHHHFSHIFPNPEPHADIFTRLGYDKLHSNVCNSSMDIWGPGVDEPGGGKTHSFGRFVDFDTNCF